jgi:hypothetical protein
MDKLQEIADLHKEAYDLCFRDKNTLKEDWLKARILYEKILLLDPAEKVALANLDLIKVIT